MTKISREEESSQTQECWALFLASIDRKVKSKMKQNLLKKTGKG